ncbi:hypothetical protein QCA50_014398 [Cerrena zonata]|uniref:YABBY protein C-terminal domain-containing protein n=1 Tax=Cerrena zonata TaxID=2478898 RepID=A0AAW0FLV1_9APHY
MAKTASETQTKAATKSANAKTTGGGKRAPSAYNKFMAEHMKQWRVDNPGRPVKDAMSAVAALWRDAPENPNRGQEPKKKTKKAPAAKPARSSKKKLPSSSDTEAAE